MNPESHTTARRNYLGKVANHAENLAEDLVDTGVYTVQIITETQHHEDGIHHELSVIISRRNFATFLCQENITHMEQVDEFFNTWKVLTSMFDHDQTFFREYTESIKHPDQCTPQWANSFIINEIAGNLPAHTYKKQQAS